MKSANLSKANLEGANLYGADLSFADLDCAILQFANLSHATLRAAKLSGLNLSKVNLSGANLSNSNLSWAGLSEADLSSADLSGALMRGAALSWANLRHANLSGAILWCANLQNAHLDGANATDIKLWETLRAGWSIRGIICDRAFWDEQGTEPTRYAPGAFERLHSDQNCIVLHYPDGASTFELYTLPALIHHLGSMHPGTTIRLVSIEEIGAGTKIRISVGDADLQKTEAIKSDATTIVEGQIALRNSELVEQLKCEMEMRSEWVVQAIIKALDEFAKRHSVAQQNFFYAPVYSALLPTGSSTANSQQTFNDNSAILPLLEIILGHRSDLGLSGPAASKFESEIDCAAAELQKKSPDWSAVSESLEFIKGTLQNFIGSLGAAEVATNWQTWLSQLSQFIQQLK
jgi:hypothetical protein